MYTDVKISEFSGRRAATYRDALASYGDAWRADIASMRRFLAPKPGERILEIGAGNGYFSRAIADIVGPDGLLVATDPSTDQLADLEAEATHGNIRVVETAAEVLAVAERDHDAAWSRGAFHHVANKTAAFERIAELVRPGGRLVIVDVFAGTQLARYFDGTIARTCCTGHEVAFLSREFAESLCALTGWEAPVFHDVTTPWEFAEREDIGRFLALLFSAKDGVSAEECLEAAERFLTVTPTWSGWALQWPMTVMTATRAGRS